MMMMGRVMVILKEMVTVCFIRKLDKCSFKLRFPSQTTGMVTLKKMVVCFIVFSTSGAVNCVLDRIIPMNQRTDRKYLV
jgi:hypothetical protein